MCHQEMMDGSRQGRFFIHFRTDRFSALMSPPDRA